MKSFRSLSSLFALGALLCALFAAPPAVQATDVSITASSVVPGANAQYRYGTAGVAISAGQLVYIDTSTNTWKLSDANASATTADVDGIAANTAGAGAPLTIITADDNLTLGGTTAKGTVYILSATAGGVAPMADLTTGWYAVVIGLGADTTHIHFRAEGLRNSAAQ